MPATSRQNEAITSHDKSTVVTGGAGTGKTFVLVQKYIDLIATKGVPVPAILALTFTDKAAAEMKERNRREISKRSGAVWEKASTDFMVAPFQTFHAFCAQVLREFPIKDGLEPGFVVLDETQMGRIRPARSRHLFTRCRKGRCRQRRSMYLAVTDQNTLRSMLSAITPHGAIISGSQSARSNPAGVITAWQKEVHAFRDNEIATLLSNPGFCSLVDTLLSLAGEYAGSQDKAAIHLSEISGHIRNLKSFTSSEDFCSAVTAILDAKMGNVGSKKAWNGDDLSKFKEARRKLREILEQKEPLLRMTVDPGDPKVTGSVRFLRELGLVFKRYLAIASEEKAKLGGLDFSDLILHTRTIFEEKRELCSDPLHGPVPVYPRG